MSHQWHSEPNAIAVTANPTNRAYIGRIIRVNKIGGADRGAIWASDFKWRP